MRKLCDGWRERCKGTAHASFIRGGYRRDTSWVIAWHVDGLRGKEKVEIKRKTKWRRLDASSLTYPLIKRIKWIFTSCACFPSLSIVVRDRWNESFISITERSRLHHGNENEIMVNWSNYFVEYASILRGEKNNKFLKENTRYDKYCGDIEFCFSKILTCILYFTVLCLNFKLLYCPHPWLRTLIIHS